MAVAQPTGPCPISTTTGTPAAVLPVPHLWPVAAGTGDCAAEVAAAGFAALPALHPVSAHPASAARASTAGKAAPAGRKGGRRMGGLLSRPSSCRYPGPHTRPAPRVARPLITALRRPSPFLHN